MSVNKVTLLGNVGIDPSIRNFDNGNSVANLTLATTDRAYSLSNGVEVPERTEWHFLVFRNGLSKIVEKYVRKGDKLYVEGKIRSRSYNDAEGIKRYVSEIFVDNMEMLTPKAANSINETGQPAPQPANSSLSQPVSPVVPPAGPQDDLPF